MLIEQQIKTAWQDYYRAIADGNTTKAKEIFERIETMSSVQLCRKTTSRMLKPVLAT